VLAVWVVLTALLSLKKGARLSQYGMVVAHIGVAVFVVGVTLVKGYDSEQDAHMKPGDTVELSGYVFTLEKVADVKGPNYRAVQATVSVTKNNQPVAMMFPEKRVYMVQDQPMTEAAIDTGVTRDLYVSLGDPLGGGAWLIKVQHKPFIDWIWGGCLVMALGGLLAASDRRYRYAQRERKLAEAPA
jgi:cytochrome c-type biogenesis protein CcmF